MRKHTIEELKLFCKEHNRLPNNSKIYKEEASLYQFLWRHKDEPEFIKLIEMYPYTTIKKKKHTFEELKLFCEKNNRLPSKSKSKEERNLYNFLYAHKDEPKFIKLKEMYPYSISKKKYTFDELKLFCEKNNRLPNCRNKEEKGLYQFFWKHKNESFVELYKKYGRYSKPDKKVEEVVKVEDIDIIIPEPEQNKSKESYNESITELIKEF